MPSNSSNQSLKIVLLWLLLEEQVVLLNTSLLIKDTFMQLVGMDMEKVVVDIVAQLQIIKSDTNRTVKDSMH